ncbi:MAG TPA: response regulator transcription factor [Solirubrobacteraceae bacterium]|nr:response regulator transcription factor [Solirubrobacteraceae bacterium]
MSNQTISPAQSPYQPMAVAPVRVLLVDDHPAVRIGMRKLVDDQPDLSVVAEASSATELLADGGLDVDVAVLDYHLDGRNGLWLTRRLKALERAPRVLIYSAFADGALAVAAIVAGADGLLGKAALGEELCARIRELARGRKSIPAITPSIAQALRSQLRPSDQAILGLLLHGVDPDEIAELLGIGRAELEARRSTMLRAVASNADDERMSARANAPLDYDRPRREARRRRA